jgi:hypothetical protein
MERFIFCEWNIILRSSVWNVGIVCLMIVCCQRLSFPFFVVLTLFRDRVCNLALRRSVFETGPVPLVAFSVNTALDTAWNSYYCLRKYILLLITSRKLTTYRCFTYEIWCAREQIHKYIISHMRFPVLRRWINIIEGTSQVSSSSNSGGARLEVRRALRLCEVGILWFSSAPASKCRMQSLN